MEPPAAAGLPCFLRQLPGVIDFFRRVASTDDPVYLSVITIGELRRGVEFIRLRGDAEQARLLESWLAAVLDHHADNVLDFDAEAAQVWGRLRAPNHEHALDKQIAAIARVHDLTMITRNSSDFAGTGVKFMIPFVAPAPRDDPGAFHQPPDHTPAPCSIASRNSAASSQALPRRWPSR